MDDQGEEAENAERLQEASTTADPRTHHPEGARYGCEEKCGPAEGVFGSECRQEQEAGDDGTQDRAAAVGRISCADTVSHPGAILHDQGGKEGEKRAKEKSRHDHHSGGEGEDEDLEYEETLGDAGAVTCQKGLRKSSDYG